MCESELCVAYGCLQAEVQARDGAITSCCVCVVFCTGSYFGKDVGWRVAQAASVEGVCVWGGGGGQDLAVCLLARAVCTSMLKGLCATHDSSSSSNCDLHVATR